MQSITHKYKCRENPIQYDFIINIGYSILMVVIMCFYKYKNITALYIQPEYIYYFIQAVTYNSLYL